MSFILFALSLLSSSYDILIPVAYNIAFVVCVIGNIEPIRHIPKTTREIIIKQTPFGLLNIFSRKATRIRMAPLLR